MFILLREREKLLKRLEGNKYASYARGYKIISMLIILYQKGQYKSKHTAKEAMVEHTKG